MQYALAAWSASELKRAWTGWRTIHGNNRLNSYHNLMWTRRLGYDLYNAYPIYDWTTEDIWTAYARFKWPFNKCTNLL